jgi:hypothetical protein
MSLVTAILTATVFASFGFPFRYYQCWYSWGGPRSYVAGLGYFAIAGGGGGLLGWLLAELSHAKPTANMAVNGFLYGAAGALALRADFRPRRTPQAKMDAAEIRNAAASILAIGLQWTGTALDEISRRQMTVWLKGLSDDDLIRQAYDVRATIRQDRRTPANTTRMVNELVVPAMESVRAKDPDKRIEGRAHLVAFCQKYFLSEHMPKPAIPLHQDSVAGTALGHAA